MTISYLIQVKSPKNYTGIGETYNGGIKTVFRSGKKTRIRLVSLMRIESIFLFSKNDANKIAAVTKESGKVKYKYWLTRNEWMQFNAKYDSANCQLTGDSATIFNYPCRKAIITFKDGRSIDVYYTDSIGQKDFSHAEPVFSCIPGVVMQYEYQYKKGSLIYTANAISETKIDAAVFRMPAKGLVTRKFSMKPITEASAEIPAEDEEEDAGSKKQ